VIDRCSRGLTIALAGCGDSVASSPASDAVIDADAPATCTGTWRVGPRLNDPREQAGTILLPDGRVLVAGAHHIDPPAGRDIGSAEIFDPVKESWSLTAPLNFVRGATRGLTVLLTGGSVLTTQQETVNFQTSSTKPIPGELYDPASATWHIVGWMTEYTNGPMAALPDGGALVMGGVDWLTARTRDNAQRYHAETGQWTATGPLRAPRVGHFALAMGDEVLVVGGADKDEGGALLVTAEVYDPKTGAFRAVGSMNEARWYPACVVLSDGRVLAAGSGKDDGRTAEIYDPKTATWTRTGSMAEARAQGSLSLLQDGRVLAAGGAGEYGDLRSAEIYDPRAGTWSSAGAMTGARRLHTAVTLRNGDVLVVGGFHYFQLSTTAIYTPCRR